MDEHRVATRRGLGSRAAGVVALLCIASSCGGVSPGPGPSEVFAYWGGLGTARVGSTVQEVEEVLGLKFDESEPRNARGDCILWTSSEAPYAVVETEPGGVRVFVVGSADVPFISSTTTPVGVGSTVDDVYEAFPRWTGSDSYRSLAGGKRVAVTPREIRGEALLMEADPDGIIQQFRVGDEDYVLHVDYCTTQD